MALPAAPNRSARLALTFSAIGHAQMHVLAALYLTVVLALESAWQLPYDELIRLWTLGALLIGVGAPLAGWLADRWSESRMMVVFFLITGLGGIATGLATGPLGIALGLSVLGIGASIYHPVGLAWVVKNATNRGQAMAFNGIFGSIGIASAGLIAGVLSDGWSWRAAMIVPGAVSVATGLVLLVLVLAGSVVDRTVDVKPQRPASRTDTIRAFVLLSITMVATGLVFHSLSTMMPKWFGQTLGDVVGEGTAGVGALVSIVYFAAALPQLVGGWLADRMSTKRLYVICLAVQVPLLALAASIGSYPLLAVAIVLAAMGSFQIPAENLLLARFTPERHRGLAFGAKFILSFGAGPVGVLLVATSFDLTGSFTLLLLALAGLAGVAFLAGALLPSDGVEPAGNATPEPAPKPTPTPAAGTAD